LFNLSSTKVFKAFRQKATAQKKVWHFTFKKICFEREILYIFTFHKTRNVTGSEQRVNNVQKQEILRNKVEGSGGQNC